MSIKESLIKKAIQGNRDSIVQLCEEVSPSVLFGIRRLLPGNQDSEDIAQEVLVRVAKNITSLKNSSSFVVWLNNIVLNETRRFAKKNVQQAEKVVYTDDTFEEIAEEEMVLLPQENLLQDEESKAIIAIIDTLPDRQREAILFHYYEDLSVTETAKVMEITQQTASQYLNAARKKLKEALEERAGQKGNARASALIGLPMGLLFSDALNFEAMQTGIQCVTWKQGVGSGVAAALGEKEATAAAATKATGTAGTSPALLIGRVLAGIAALIGAGMLIFVFMFATPGAPTQEKLVPKVVFSGGSAEFANLNPGEATVVIEGAREEITYKEWAITPAYGGKTLFSGSGSSVQAPFTQLPEGEYEISFTLEDKAGVVYTASRTFQIRNQN